MEEEKISVEEGFYQECADLLGIPSTYVKRSKYWKRTRWTNRQPGAGRLPGYGLIRMFGPNMIHMNLHTPVHVNRVFGSTTEALSFLKKLIDSNKEPS